MALVLVLLAALPWSALSAPVSAVSDTAAVEYLSRYGYLETGGSGLGHSEALVTDSVKNAALAQFQAFAGIPVTGRLDETTRAVMRTPRCGVKDVLRPNNGTSSEYQLAGSKWTKRLLTYRISSYPRQIRRDVVDYEISRAFKIWSTHADITFSPVPSGFVDIDIRFASGLHGDPFPFEGPGGTLAHAFFPINGGDVHFDNDEQWSYNTHRGTNLFQTAAHEIGHSLGLEHSRNRRALMAPYYTGYIPNFRLPEDDILGIQRLYGRSRRAFGKLMSVTMNRQLNCEDIPMDAMFFNNDGALFSIKGNMSYKLTEDGLATGYPRPISQTWVGLPDNTGAAFFSAQNNKTYFFKGATCWRYSGYTLDRGFPRRISDEFPGIPADLDAALATESIHFFKGQSHWTVKPPRGTPEQSEWRGVPDNLNAAFVYRGRAYFVKGNHLYSADNATSQVVRSDSPFPHWPLGCDVTTPNLRL